MKVIVSLLTVAATCVELIYGFSATNCDTGKVYQFGQDGNCKCHLWTTPHMSYDSDKGLALKAYPLAGCQGDPEVYNSQDVCFEVPFTPGGIIAC